MNADDPKFTAHVLGEFEDLTPAERAEIEALMANDPTAAAAAEETRALAARLRAELPGEALGALDAKQRAAVLGAAKIKAAPGGKVVHFPRQTTALAALVACLIVGVSYGLLLRTYDLHRAAKHTERARKEVAYLRGTTFAPADPTGRPDSEPAPAPSADAAFAALTSQPVMTTRYSPGKDVVEHESVTNTSTFGAINENGFVSARENPFSTFSVDVDTASYAIVRRYLNDSLIPPKGAVRVEELLNYFTYDYPQPKGDAPFSATMEVATCPWMPAHRLVRVGLKGREIPKNQRPPSNLVFLIDVSGSMNMPNKLPLIQKCFSLLVEQLGPTDRVSIVTYASGTTVVLEPTQNKEAMQSAIAGLRAGGCTYGSSGIEVAYKLAGKSFIAGGTNRVILATDGDWNVGITDERELMQMITAKAKSGVFLTVLGCGMDNLKDSMLVKLADHGNGHYAYIDTELEARKVFVEQLSSTLVTIAKDVKIQVEFNPAQVSSYRLIGYEKRLLAKEDFNDDKKDAGEIGAGHTVTALYEVVPVGKERPDIAKVAVPAVKGRASIIVDNDRDDAARSNVLAEARPLPASVRNEMLTLKLRYKEPDGEKSKLLEFPLTDRGTTWEKSSPDFRFAAAVASYGMLLRGSNYLSEATWQSTAEWAREGLGLDQSGYRSGFLGLLEKTRALKHQ
jgi:Ca-activated chloride channel family protein